MYYADAGELVAELILHPHACGPDCLCWELRKVPAIDEILQRLGVPKYQTISEAIEDLVQKLQAEKVQSATRQQ